MSPLVLKLSRVAVLAPLALGCASGKPAVSPPEAPSAAVARFAPANAGGPDVGAARLEVVEAGRVALPNGRLAVSDAFVNDGPLIVADIGRGDYPVELLLAKSASDERVAAARLRIRNEPVTSWRLVGGIPIDSGTGALFDPQISSGLKGAEVERFNDRLLAALSASAQRPYSSAVMSWQGLTLIAFSTGFGDGRYPVFLGTSAAGAPVSVVVDCEILPWRQEW